MNINLKTRISDPIKAQEKIKKMKNCSGVHVLSATEASANYTSEANGSEIIEELQNAIHWLFDRYTFQNKATINNLKSFNQSIGDYALWHEENENLTDLVLINMITINGIETWLVQDFNFGPKKSKWFRGKSVESQNALHLAMLKFANIKVTDVDPKKNFEINGQNSWDQELVLDNFINQIINELNAKNNRSDTGTADEVEMSYSIKIEKTSQCFTGKSKKYAVPKNVKDGQDEMAKQRRNLERTASREARKLAEKKFYNGYFGVDGVKKFTFDELGRPVDVN